MKQSVKYIVFEHLCSSSLAESLNRLQEYVVEMGGRIIEIQYSTCAEGQVHHCALVTYTEPDIDGLEEMHGELARSINHLKNKAASMVYQPPRRCQVNR